MATGISPSATTYLLKRTYYLGLLCAQFNTILPNAKLNIFTCNFIGIDVVFNGISCSLAKIVSIPSGRKGWKGFLARVIIDSWKVVISSSTFQCNLVKTICTFSPLMIIQVGKLYLGQLLKKLFVLMVFLMRSWYWLKFSAVECYLNGWKLLSQSLLHLHVSCYCLLVKSGA